MVLPFFGRAVKALAYHRAGGASARKDLELWHRIRQRWAVRFRSLALILFLAATGLAQTPKKEPKPLDRVQVLALLAGSVSSQRVAMLVEQRGIDFEPTEDYLNILQGAGAEEMLLKALRKAKGTLTPAVDPATAAKQAQIQQHLARGLEVRERGLYPEAEQEFRAAIKLEPANPDLRQDLGIALVFTNDLDGAIAEFRTAIRLQPDNADAHSNLGKALSDKGDLEKAILEYRTATRLQPDFAVLHSNLADALFRKGGLDEAIAESRTAVRLDPDSAEGHMGLGVGFIKKGDIDAATAEFWTAIRLKPDYARAYHNLGTALHEKGDLDAAIAEYRTAIRLGMGSYADETHYLLGSALEAKGDLDGAVAQFRTAIRLKPETAAPHYRLGRVLYGKGDFPAALDELRQAYLLEPSNPEYRKAYEASLSRAN